MATIWENSYVLVSLLQILYFGKSQNFPFYTAFWHWFSQVRDLFTYIIWNFWVPNDITWKQR